MTICPTIPDDGQLWDVVERVGIDLQEFSSEAAGWLPDSACSAIKDERLIEIVSAGKPTATRRDTLVSEAALRLRLIRSEVDYQLKDTEALLRSRTERALLHLQWSIRASTNIQSDWRTAFSKNEPACENLGATHLLQHGIFAFKANTQKARTDLVFYEPIDKTSRIVAEGLVLTEWKTAKTENELERKISAAQTQAAIYASGPLQAAELRSVRYIIIVTEKQMEMPPDEPREGYIFRHSNIAVDPDSPSEAGQKSARKKSQNEEA